jgi:hypothetical protein
MNLIVRSFSIFDQADYVTLYIGKCIKHTNKICNMDFDPEKLAAIEHTG